MIQNEAEIKQIGGKSNVSRMVGDEERWIVEHSFAGEFNRISSDGLESPRLRPEIKREPRREHERERDPGGHRAPSCTLRHVALRGDVHVDVRCGVAHL